MRYRSRRADIWFAAMLPNLKTVPSLEEFCDGARPKGQRIAEWVDAWDKVDRALARNSAAAGSGLPPTN